jgi:hypothetical protein
MPKLRISAALLYATGTVLALIGFACLFSSYAPVSHPVAHALMYLWFAGLAFFAAWIVQTQPRVTD